MATFLTDLFQSIFTPGPTPTLLVATNAAFAALQVLLLALLIATYSIHFIILSFLCGGLWWAINWFAAELQAAKEKEEKAKKLKDLKKERDARHSDDSGTETEDAMGRSTERAGTSESGLRPPVAEDALRKRRSLGDVSSSGEMSTDSEWDKVENEVDSEN